MEHVSKIISLVSLVLLLHITAIAANGELSKIVIVEKGENEATLELHIRERIKEEINDFNTKIKDEDIYVDPEYVGQGAVLVLDKISLGKVDVSKISSLPFIDELIIREVVGSFKIKELRANENGREFNSTRLIFKSKQGLDFRFLEREKNEAEPIYYRIRVSAVDSEGEKKSSLNPHLFKKYEEFNAFATRNPIAKVVEQEHFSIKRKDLINKIQVYDKTKYLTAIHQLMNISGTEAISMVEAQLSPDGKIIQSRDTDMLVVTDQKPYVLNILQILGQVDQQAPEVQIEVKIIELQEGAGRELGFNWKGEKQSGNRKVSTELVSSIASKALVNGTQLAQNILNGVVVDGLDSLSLSISALIKNGRAKIMAEPKLLVANNQKGNFKMTKKHPILIRKAINVSQSTVNSNRINSIQENQNTQNNTLLDQDTFYPTPLAAVGASNTVDKDERKSNSLAKLNSNTLNEVKSTTNRNDNYSEVLFETGITLTVTPSIRKSGVIRLTLNPKITEMNENDLSDSPSLSIREINTVAYVGDGDTLLIGGLMYDKEERIENRIPILSKIPGLGRFFKSEKSKKSKTELIFLVKTRIVKL
jgi:Flp pilus assembly secretin CpaC